MTSNSCWDNLEGMSSTDSAEGPSDLSMDVWMDYAKKGKISELDDSLVRKFGLIEPEGSSGIFPPARYAEQLKEFVVNRTFGEDRLADIYVTRRASLGLRDAKEKFDSTNKDFTQTGQFEDGIMRVLMVIADKYANTGENYKDFSNPELIVSIFGPVMAVLPREKIVKVLNTVTNGENRDKILKAYEEEEKTSVGI